MKTIKYFIKKLWVQAEEENSEWIWKDSSTEREESKSISDST